MNWPIKLRFTTKAKQINIILKKYALWCEYIVFSTVKSRYSYACKYAFNSLMACEQYKFNLSMVCDI